VVASVQCKYVRHKTKWKGIKTKMSEAVKAFVKAKVANFPVIYTTADQKNVMEST
jgi:hypothetical protein